jgi:hypothetical protein
MACADREPMLELLRDRVSDRKLRLFACACFRRVFGLLPDEASRAAVEVAERFAEGLAGEEELAAARVAAWESVPQAAAEDAWEAARSSASAAAFAAAWSTDQDVGPMDVVPPMFFRGMKGDAGGADVSAWDAAWFAERKAQTALLRDLFGNPFRPAPAMDPAVLAWEGGAMVNLARLAYDERVLPEGTLDPTRLGVLADALEDASCTDADILGHLRGPGLHARGCWVLDALLGREEERRRREP